MERHLKDIKFLLYLAVLFLGIIVCCQICLVTVASEPSRAEAKSEQVIKVDIVKVGSYYISKHEFLGGKK